MEKMLRINMSNLSIREENVCEEYKKQGGRGLSASIMVDEVKPTCHPLGKNNKIIISPGMLSGTMAPCSGRISFGGKSPLTGGIKESNVGGTVSRKMVKLGYKAIIIEGKSIDNSLCIIKIDQNGTEIIKSDELKGKGTYETAKILQAKYGRNYAVACIGPAGEEKLLIASIAVTDMEGHPCRHAGRGGLGAVLGSKGVKAILFDNKDQDDVHYVNKDSFKKKASAVSKNLIQTKAGLKRLGTSNLVNLVNSLQGLPTNNFRKGSFEGVEKINSDALLAKIAERNGKTGHPCSPGCVIQCSNIYNDENGEYLTSALEYETIALVGSNCGIDDLDIIAKVDRLCDDFGIDTMDTGAAIGVLMESGIIKFGDKDAVINILEEIRKLTPFGRIIASGANITGKVFGVERVPVVKGQAISAYDPRSFKGTGVTYATSAQGGDHTAGNCLPARGGYREHIKDPSKILSSDSGTIQVDLSRDVQILTTVCDCMGICFFAGSDMEYFSQMLNYRFGTDFTSEDLLEMGLNTIKTEIKFNEEAGISKGQNKLPEFFMEEELDDCKRVFDIDENAIEKIF